MHLSNVDEYWVADLRKEGLLEEIPAAALQLYSAAPDSEESDLIEEVTQKRTPAGDATTCLYLSDSRNDFFGVPQMGNVGILVYRSDGEPPNTLEELEETCKRLKTANRPSMLLLETQTDDSLLATVLELGWAHGAFWTTQPLDAEGCQITNRRFRIVFEKDSSYDNFLQAIERLHRWIHIDKIVPPNSTVDPKSHPEDDWVFARHWYSTWIDVLTRTDGDGELLAKIDTPRTNWGIARIPVAKEYCDREKKKGREARCPSCWGEWYLALQRGSENRELGVELINNLMSSRKVTDRALSGAGLPLQKQFYHDYGEVICFGTDLTYNEFRQRFFKSARSRTQFFEFPTVATVLLGAIRAVINNPSADVKRLLSDAFLTIDPQAPI